MSAEQRRITLTQEDDGWWVATDEGMGEHGVTSQGETRKEALDNLDEAVALYKGEIGHPPTDNRTAVEERAPEDIIENLETFLAERDVPDAPPFTETVRDDYHAHRHRENLERLARDGE